MKAAKPGLYVDPSGLCLAGSQTDGRKAAFLDRDGVINVDHGYVHSRENTDWVEGIFDLCRYLRGAGYWLVVVTNQAGIARGYYTESQFLEYTRWIHSEFSRRGAPLLATCFCPHHPNASDGALRMVCGCRKPAPGMIVEVARQFDIWLAASILIGDKPSDIEAGIAAGVGHCLLLERSRTAEGDLMGANRIMNLADARGRLAGLL